MRWKIGVGRRYFGVASGFELGGKKSECQDDRNRRWARQQVEDQTCGPLPYLTVHSPLPSSPCTTSLSSTLPVISTKSKVQQSAGISGTSQTGIGNASLTGIKGASLTGINATSLNGITGSSLNGTFCGIREARVAPTPEATVC